MIDYIHHLDRCSFILNQGGGWTDSICSFPSTDRAPIPRHKSPIGMGAFFGYLTWALDSSEIELIDHGIETDQELLTDQSFNIRSDQIPLRN